MDRHLEEEIKEETEEKTEEKTVEEIKDAFQNNDHDKVLKKTMEYLEKSNSIPLNIAITGECGSGKSTFVNALRDVDNRDKDAAPTGVVETTMEPTEYLHPNHPNIKIWDLPGIGTTRFTSDKYLKHMGFDKFDFFIIVSDTRFRENDAKLAQEIQKMKKKFYFVRSKIDDSMNALKRSQKEFNEENTLQRIRDNCIKELQKLGVESPKVFLVSSFELHLYEFKALWETLEKELPQHQRDVLLLALPNISLDVINKKKKTLEAKIKWFALASAAGAAVPVPGFSVPVDIGIIAKFAKLCQSSFGLTDKTLHKLSSDACKSLDDLQTELKSQLALVEITKELTLKVLATSAAWTAAALAEEGARFIPLLGIPIAMGLSFVSTYQVLHFILDKMAKDAQKVFIIALGLNRSV